MKTLWITYSWKDNKDNDVEFIAQELEDSGIIVKLDRWNIQAGKRLWEQLEKFITDPNECDGWSIFATQNSLGSQPCKEEVAYALDRALSSRGDKFPLIGIFPSTIESEIIPAAIKTRLYVSLKDEDWIERIKSSIENRPPSITKKTLDPYSIDVHELNGKTAVEIRPRAVVWSPFFCGILLAEREMIKPQIFRGPKGKIQTGGMKNMYRELNSDDKIWWIMSAIDEATPTQSYYLICEELPSKICFGVFNDNPQYVVDLK